MRMCHGDSGGPHSSASSESLTDWIRTLGGRLVWSERAREYEFILVLLLL